MKAKPPTCSHATPAPVKAREKPEFHYCYALLWFSFRGKRYPVLPLTALLYAAIGVGIICLAVAISEWNLTRRSGSFAHDKRVDSPEWYAENENILAMDSYKLRDMSPEKPVWHSKGFPVVMDKIPSHGHRILVLGDSFVWGDGYANMNDLWWRQLQRELNRRGYWDVEVVAMGLNGAATGNEFYWLRDFNLAARLHADFILWGYVSNDADSPGSDGESLVRQMKHHRELIIETNWGRVGNWMGRSMPAITYQLDKLLNQAKEGRNASVATGYPYEEWELKLLEGENFEVYKALLAVVSDYLRKLAVPYAFITLPNRPDRGCFQKRFDCVAPEFKKAGLTFHDTLDASVAEYPKPANPAKWQINPANAHPGPSMTHLYAVQAANLLEHNYPDVLGPKTAAPVLAPVINDWMPPWLIVTPSASNEWHVSFPGTKATIPKLSMPLRRAHALFSFENPIGIDSIEITFSSPVTAELLVTRVDRKLGFDPDNLESLGTRSGVKLVWSSTGAGKSQDPVNTIRIASDFLAQDKPMEAVVTIKLAESPKP